jgi:hypothetical protein
VLSPPPPAWTVNIDDQAICCFIKNFVLLPVKGNSRSYLDFTVTAIKQEKTLSSTKSPLTSAVMALSMAFLANQQHSNALVPRAAMLYASALQKINTALMDPHLAIEDDTLAAVIILGLFEVRI